MISHMPNILKGHRIQLEPLATSHRDELYALAQDESIWTYNSSKAYGDRFNQWFEKALTSFKEGQHLPFAVRRLSDQMLVGSTRYYDINPANRRLTIGYTWYIPEVWGSHVNPECKYLLLKNAFEELHFNRVEFVTDARNLRSRAAIIKIGATEEGLLRQHMLLEDGTLRDTVVFSITQSEWPAIKSNLESRLRAIVTPT